MVTFGVGHTVAGMETAETDFLRHLVSELLKSSPRHEFDNVDTVRYQAPRPSIKTTAKNKFIGFAERCGFYRVSAIDDGLSDQVLKTPGLARAYGLLEDQASRDLFVKLLAYRILGPRHVRLPSNNAKYWELRRSLDKYVEERNVTAQIPILGSLDLCKINGVRLKIHHLGILHTFLLEQYRCERGGIGVKPADVVIDGGGCWGDTALYFALKAVRVFCFECMPSNLKIIQENLALNPSLAGKINVVQKALWSRSGEKFIFEDSGAGSRRSSDGRGVEVETQTVDDLVSTNSLQRVDFIKMDIEGSEPEALKGAERTIREHRPQLAISIYHDVGHFGSIPNWIADLNLGYRFYLDHFTIHQEETVLFARSDSCS